MRTPAYQFTINSIDDDKLKNLRDTIKLTNKFNKIHDNKLLRVCVLPRFGVKNPARPKNYRNGTCKISVATRFDVYVQVR